MPRNISIFPSDLRNAGGSNRSYPYIAFSYYDIKKGPGPVIFLPMPPGLEIGDSMEYNTIDLGIVGDIISKGVDNALNAIGGAANADISKVAQATFGSVADMTNAAINKAKSANAAAGLSIASKSIPVMGDQISNVVDFASRQIIAPNRNTTFQGSNIRSFSFRFKMVARSAAESNTIKNIVNDFRENLYPAGNDIIMEYPGTWMIQFCKETGRYNDYLPKIYRCYMTSFSSMYNSSNNMWHDDGSPIEVDVNASFQEIRALRKSDIRVLNGKTPEEDSSFVGGQIND